MRATLPARYGEAIFWLARYMERIENLARMLDVTESFARDDRGVGNWRSVAQINGDDALFHEKYPQASGADALRFYMLDGDNPTSIRFAMRAAYQNARTLRPLISTEMWAQINVFNKEIEGLVPADIAPSRLSGLCSRIKDGCHTHAGLIEATFYRDQGWYFYQLGKYLERADQATRLLDVHHHLLTVARDDLGADRSEWQILLRASAGYHAFRRVSPRGISLDAVVGFMLFDEAFPRSIRLCVRTVGSLLERLRQTYPMLRSTKPLECYDELDASLTRAVAPLIAAGLHDYLDLLQQQLGGLSNEITRAYFEV
ncbi:MAG: alpha-E domain-containing protein [Proteobacteria bacterium]|nr:alpha-E domain-containing protein [Pseudomonadota bacterium]